MAELLEKPRRRIDGGDALGMRLGTVDARRADADTEPAGIGADVVAIPTRGRRRGVRVAGAGSGGRVQHRRRVSDSAGEHVLVGQRSPELAEVRAERRAGASGLEANETARARRKTDRTAHVVAVRDGDDAGRDRGGGASARSPRREVEVPGIVRRTVRERFRRHRARELGQVGLADEHEPRGAEALGEPRVGLLVPVEVLQHLHAAMERITGRVADPERN